jgi:hypothetical protein
MDISTIHKKIFILETLKTVTVPTPNVTEHVKQVLISNKSFFFKFLMSTALNCFSVLINLTTLVINQQKNFIVILNSEMSKPQKHFNYRSDISHTFISDVWQHLCQISLKSKRAKLKKCTNTE